MITALGDGPIGHRRCLSLQISDGAFLGLMCSTSLLRISSHSKSQSIAAVSDSFKSQHHNLVAVVGASGCKDQSIALTLKTDGKITVHGGNVHLVDQMLERKDILARLKPCGL